MAITIDQLLSYEKSKLFYPEAMRFISFQGLDNELGILSRPYFSVFNPMFGLCIDDLNVLSPYDHVCLRDGFLGLIAFFGRHPFPTSNFKTLIGVPHCFEKLIPRLWREKIFLYKFSCINQQFVSNRLHLCVLPELDFSFADSTKLLWTNKYLKDKKIKKTSFDLLINKNFYQNRFIANKSVETVLELQSFSAQPFSSQSYESFQFQLDLSDLLVLRLLEPFLIYDDFLMHFFSARQARVLEYRQERALEKDVSCYPLSLYHQIMVIEPSDNLGAFHSQVFKAWKKFADSYFFGNISSLVYYRSLFKELYL